jgi:predicted dehydrogenase
MNKKCLIIGYGSIGKRHAKVLKNMGNEVHIVTEQKINKYKIFRAIPDSRQLKAYDYIVISIPTADHYKALTKLSCNGFSNTLLMEKPLFDNLPLSGKDNEFVKSSEKSYNNLSFPFQIFIGYNLRFHPVLQKIYDLIEDQQIYSMHVYCGQYLPLWRENQDYKKNYSANKKLGGGVLRDLSHELDYICWLTGEWQSVAALGGKFSNLEIDSDDLFCILLETKKCPAVSLQINYLDLNPKRQIIINTQDFSLKADLIKGILEINDKKQIYDVKTDDSYINEHHSILSGENSFACTYEEGIHIVELIEACEKAAKGKIWVKRD